MAVKKKAVIEDQSVIDMWSSILNSKQYLLADEGSDDNVYEEVPVSAEEFVSVFLGVQPQRGIIDTTVVAPSVLSDPQKEFIDTATNFDNNITNYVLWVGKGGGKNTVSCMTFCYALYKLLCMRDPHAYFGHSPLKPMTLLNVGGNAIQGKKNFFDPLKDMIRSPKFLEWLAGKGFNPERDILNNEIIMPKGIQLYSGHTGTAGIEGFDVLFGLVDECDDAGFTNAENIFRTLDTSASTRFGPRRKVITISFRRYVGSSGVLKKLYHAFDRRESAYARRYATWEFNNRPQLHESLLEYIENNPEEAACMVESKDDEGYFDSWIKDTKRIETAMKQHDRTWIFNMPVPEDNWADIKSAEYTWIDEVGQHHTLDPEDIPIKRRGQQGVKYVLCGDPGLGSVAANGDAFGITLAHAEETVDEEGKIWRKPIIDFAFRFTGRMFPQGEVQIVAVSKLITKLIEDYGYDIQIFSFDGWQSASTTQWIAKTYPGAIVMHKNLVETRDFTALRDAIFSEALPTGSGTLGDGVGVGLFWHPILYWELKELRVDKAKGKIDHTEHSSKDIADTVAKAVRLITLQWPFAPVMTSGSAAAYDLGTSEGAKRLQAEMKRIDDQQAKVEYVVNQNSRLVGLGAFKKGR